MARKRFTDADKWEDGWFCELPSETKLFWLYLCDRCDHAGVWEVNWRLAKFHLPALEQAEIELNLAGKISVIKGGKAWFIPGFITFQYPLGLSSVSPAHKRIRLTLLSHGLNPDSLVYTVQNRVINTPEDKDIYKDKDKDKEEDEEEDKEHDGLCAAYPAGDKRIYPQTKARVGLPEWIVHHPRCVLGKDRDLWQALFDRATHETMTDAYGKYPGDNKIWFSDFNKFINDNYEA